MKMMLHSNCLPMKILSITSCLLLLIAVNLFSTPTLEHELLQPEELYIGTPLTLQVTFITDTGTDIYHPVRDTVGVFAILNIEKSEETPTERRRQQTEPLPDNKKRTIYRYTLAGFDTGMQIIPPFRFELYSEQSNQTEVLSTPPFRVTITSVLADSIGTIKDIAPLIRLRHGFWDYFIPLLIIALIVGMIIVIIRKMKKPLAEALPEIEEDPRPAYIKALELLDNLRKRKLLEKGEYIEYHYRLSLVLRIFLELHFKFKAVEMTTAEIKECVTGAFDTEAGSYAEKPLFKQYRELVDLLNYADLVKFAKYVPNVTRSLEFTEWLEKYLRSFASSEASNVPKNLPCKQSDSSNNLNKQ